MTTVNTKNRLYLLCFTCLAVGRLAAQSVIYESGGKVGIGAPIPEEKLEVKGGNILVSGTTNPYLMLKSSASGLPYGFLQFDATDGNYMRLFDGSAYAMTWRAGNVGIANPNPGYKLDVSGGSIVSNAPWGHPWGFGIETMAAWTAWARQYSFFASDGTQLAALGATGGTGNAIDHVFIVKA